MVKVLCREGDGLSIWSRRLGRGQFSLPGTTPGTSGWRRASRRASWRASGRSATAGGTAPSSDSRDFLCAYRIAGTFSAHEYIYRARARVAFRQWGVWHAQAIRDRVARAQAHRRRQGMDTDSRDTIIRELREENASLMARVQSPDDREAALKAMVGP